MKYKLRHRTIRWTIKNDGSNASIEANGGPFQQDIAFLVSYVRDRKIDWFNYINTSRQADFNF